MKTILVLLVFIGMLSVGSYATTVSVSSVNVQQNSGFLTYVYYETANAGTTTTPAADTSLTSPATTGSYTIASAGTDYIWSTQFAAARSIPAGSWVLDLWVSASKAGTLTVSIVSTNSAGTAQSTILSTGTTASITTTKTQVLTRFTGAAGTVPASGYLRIKLTGPSGTTFTVYWGKAQLTDFQFVMSAPTS
ncbi:MAG: hypothetical protein ABSA72_06495 [Nitrososphaerales archaeon]|jgi:hypothetical protein